MNMCHRLYTFNVVISYAVFLNLYHPIPTKDVQTLPFPAPGPLPPPLSFDPIFMKDTITLIKEK